MGRPRRHGCIVGGLKVTLRKGHGAGKGMPRIEVLPADELPMPIPAPPAASTNPVRRRPNGTIADPESAKALGSMGGTAKALRIRLVSALGLADVAEGAPFTPYRRAADEFLKSHVVGLAAQAGGVCGDGPSTIVGSAALQLASSRFLFDQGAKTGDPTLLKLASQMANDSRQNLLAAYELAVREAQARPRVPVDPMAHIRRMAEGDK